MPSGPIDVPAELYVAVITVAGQQFVFDAAQGEDLGAYKGEFVHQRCIRVMRRDTALTVYFRPDVGVERLEVVVELGHCWLAGSGLKPEHIATPYTCDIRYKGKSVNVVQVPYQWWWSRWRWQSAPRPVVRAKADLLSKKLIPPFGASGLYGLRASGSVVDWPGPMGTGHLMTGMASPGDREEIGLFTECQAEFLVSGSRSALASMLSQAEACGTMPMHWRDERTGALVDLYKYPTLGANSADTPSLPAAIVPRAANNGPVDIRYFLVEQAHTPPLAYLPYLLTDDPFFLEELEALATMAVCRASYHRVVQHLPGVVPLGETRAFAWSMRSLFQLGVIAPESPPAWLHDRKYWRRCVADNLIVFTRTMNSPSRLHHLFRAFPITSMISGWQNCYVGVVLAMAVWMGYEEWRAPLEWFFKGITDLCNGKSGWNKQWPCPYYYHPYRPWKTAGTMGLIPDTRCDADTAASYAEAWEDFKVENKIDDKGWDGRSIMQEQSGPVYYLYLRGTLAFATHLGVPETAECQAYISSALPSVMAKYRVPGNARWSIDPA